MHYVLAVVYKASLKSVSLEAMTMEAEAVLPPSGEGESLTVSWLGGWGGEGEVLQITLFTNTLQSLCRHTPHCCEHSSKSNIRNFNYLQFVVTTFFLVENVHDWRTVNVATKMFKHSSWTTQQIEESHVDHVHYVILLKARSKVPESTTWYA